LEETAIFYEPDKGGHGLPRDPFKGLVVPRPIGWISSVDRLGRPNLAPYSFFNAVCTDPPCVMFGAASRPDGTAQKDSHRNAEETGGFVVNMVRFDQREAMNETSASLAHGTNEFEAAGVQCLPSRLVAAPRVKGAYAHLECVYLQTVEMPTTIANRRNFVVFGRVVGIHIDEAILSESLVDVGRAAPLARLGYMDYSVVRESFRMDRPASYRSPDSTAPHPIDKGKA